MSKDSGFSLVELLVAMVATLILMAVALETFSDGLRVNESVVLMAEMDQNLRAGTNLLIRDFLLAGGSIPVGGIALPNGPGATPVRRPGPGSLTFTTGGVNWTSVPSVTPGAGLGPVVFGQQTDIVNMLYADNTLPLNQFPAYVSGNPSTTTIALNGSSMSVDPSLPISGVGNPVVRGDLILFVNAEGTALQQVTSVAGQTINFATGDAFNINQRGTAPAGTILQLRPGASWPPTAAWRVYLTTYYLDATTNPQQPRLIRQVNVNPPQPVGETLENLQISYDLVSGGTYTVNVKSPVNPNLVRKVNLYLAARSSAPFSKNRRFFRNNLTTQVSLRNLAFVDQYP